MKTPVMNTGGDDDGSGPDALTALEGTAKGAVRQALQFDHAPRRDKAGSELHGLHFAAPDQVRAGNARREAHVVFDSARHPSLPPNGDILHHEGLQAFGSGVHGGGNARRATTDDHHFKRILFG